MTGVQTCALPIYTLCVWLGEGSHNPNLSGAVRRLLVARGAGDSILLYYCNEADGSYYACETTLTYAGRVEESLAPYDGNGASFAFETGSEGVYSVLDPDTLLSAAALSPRIYRASNPLADGGALEQLQRSLSFRAQGDSGYLVQGGIRFREGRETRYHLSFRRSRRLPLQPGADRANRLRQGRLVFGGSRRRRPVRSEPAVPD